MPQWHNHCQRLPSLGERAAAGLRQSRGTETRLKAVLPRGRPRLQGRKAFAQSLRAAVYVLHLAATKQKALEKAPAGDRRIVTLMQRDPITSHAWKTHNKVLAPALL